MMFGEYPINNKLARNFENFNTLFKWIDGIVTRCIEENDKNPIQEGDEKCVMDIMLLADVYKTQPRKMANDLIILILAAQDTSKNTIIFTMCYLIKNKLSRDKVLEEVKAHAQMRNLEQGTQLNPSKEDLGNNFKFLNRCINEAMRFNPPAPMTDQYIIKEDVEFDGIKWTKGSCLLFYIWGIHHDEDVW